MTTKLMLCLTCQHPAVTIPGWYACLNALCPDYDGQEIKEAKPEKAAPK